MSNFLAALEQISSQDLFFCIEPELADFTCNKAIVLKLSSKDTEIQIPLSNDQTKIREMLGLLQVYLGNEQSVLITWKIKNFLTYAKAQTGIDFVINGNVLDLSILENYLSIDIPKPTNFSEAFARIKKLMISNNWNKVYNIYNKIYRPLIDVLPKIESLGLINKKKKKKVFSYYEIDGQINGRMKCSNAFSSSFNPHTLSFEEKENICPIGFDKTFISFDFKHMEVTTLQWLSGDDFLMELISSGRDTYEALWEAITSTACNSNNRQKCKDFFLPVVFGLGAKTLSEDMKIPLEYSKILIDRIYKTIPISMAWIKKQQESIVDNKIKDHFGRVRVCESPYKARNFSVQSPASLVCTHKLTKLSKALGNLADVGMYIHDGYVLVCKKSNVNKTINISKEMLENDDELYPGLKFKVVCKTGDNLNNLVTYER